MDGEWWQGLTERQRRFCEAYASNGGNALAAAGEAGYKVPHPEGQRLLHRATVRAALEKLRLASTSKAIMTREERQEMWSKMALDPDLEPQHRLRASELLGKSQADFVDRSQVDVGVVVTKIKREIITL